MKLFTILLVILGIGKTAAQELFIATEPASNMPKSSYGFSVSSKSFSRDNTLHTQNDLGFMYEETADFMTHLMLHASNYYSNYSYNNFGVYAKYRLYTDDGFKQHFRVAAYTQAAFGKDRNTYADIMLDGGNSGLETGLIFTLLENHFALSSTIGAISFIPDVNASPEVQYRNVHNYDYSLSAGYLVYPPSYTGYDNVNINIYVECLGKYITYDRSESSVSSSENGTVLDIAIGPQLILNSISRIDLSIRKRVISGVAGFPTPSFYLRFEQMFYH